MGRTTSEILARFGNSNFIVNYSSSYANNWVKTCFLQNFLPFFNCLIVFFSVVVDVLELVVVGLNHLTKSMTLAAGSLWDSF
jgi:hypothetical protein